MKYFAIDNGMGYPSRFTCERCADTARVTSMDVINRLDPLPQDREAIGTWCDSCSAPLDTPANDDRRVVNTLEMLTSYNSAPVTRFQPVTRARLNEIAKDINDPATERTAATEWSRNDQTGVASALALLSRGYVIFVAQDEDGWYFAALTRHVGFDEKTRPFSWEKASVQEARQ